MKIGAIVWTTDLNGAVRVGKILDGVLIGKALGRVDYFRCLRWRRAQGHWAKTPTVCAVVGELTPDELSVWRLEYEPPRVTLAGNLNDLLEAVREPAAPKKAVG